MTTIAELEASVGRLVEALADYLAERDKDDWCQRIKYGQCTSRKCVVTNADQSGPPYDLGRATCARWRLECARQAIADHQGHGQ